MKAPEKIYLDPALDALTKALSVKTEADVEYIRADVFIEKAATWFANRYQVNGYLDADDIVDFKNYMKGE